MASVGRPFGGGVVGATTAVGTDVAVPLPFAFFAVTITRSRNPRSARRTPYVVPVAPTTSVQTTASMLQRCHWYPNDVGLPLQEPGEARSSSPTRAVPVMVGADVFFGAAVDVTGATVLVCADCAEAEPSAFVAVTRTRIVWPASAPTSV